MVVYDLEVRGSPINIFEWNQLSIDFELYIPRSLCILCVIVSD